MWPRQAYMTFFFVKPAPIFSRGSVDLYDPFVYKLEKQVIRICSVVFFLHCLLAADRNVLLQATSKPFKSLFGHVQSLWTSSLQAVSLECTSHWRNEWSGSPASEWPLRWCLAPLRLYCFTPKQSYRFAPLITMIIRSSCATVAPDLILAVWQIVDRTLSQLQMDNKRILQTLMGHFMHVQRKKDELHCNSICQVNAFLVKSFSDFF